MTRLPQFGSGDELPCDSRYQVLDKTGAGKNRHREARHLGAGNVGLVYRALYKGILHRAIKFMAPIQSPDVASLIPLDELRGEFEREIEMLAKVTHTNIAKIVDYGGCEIDGVTYPYYVTEFIDGVDFGTFVKTCTGEEFYSVVGQFLAGLVHLHGSGFYHLDIKEENVFVQGARQPSRRSATGVTSTAHTESLWHAPIQPVVLDLGGAKPVPSYKSTDDHLTTYYSTEKAVRPERKQHLGRRVKRSLLKQWDADSDLYSVGRMLRDATADLGLERRVSVFLQESGMRALRWLIARLMENASDETRFYKSARQLADDWAKLAPSYTWPLGMQELSLIPGERSIQIAEVRVGMTGPLMDIVNHPSFNRLLELAQLEYVNQVYPDATHTRFGHSLLTFHFARIFLVQLLEYADFRMIATPSHIRATLLTALLHDVGHYPLSHAFEDFTSDALKQRVEQIPDRARPISDEGLFAAYVDPNQRGGLPDAIQRFVDAADVDREEGDVRSKPLAVVIRDLFPEAQALMLPIMKLERSDPPFPTLHAIINSVVDADKIAYLVADSRATGLNFGRGLDVDGLIASLMPPRGEGSRAGLSIREDGLAAAESVIAARFWMISRAYWHRTNRAAMAMHKFVITSLMQADAFDFAKYFEETLGHGHRRGTELLDTWYRGVRASTKESFRRPIAGLPRSNRQLYKRIVTVPYGPREAEKVLHQAMANAMPFDALDAAEAIRRRLESQFRVSFRYGDVVVDIPQKGRDSLGSSLAVYQDREPDQPLSFHDVAPLLGGAQRDFEANVKKARVFVHPDTDNDLKAFPPDKVVRTVVEELLSHYRLDAHYSEEIIGRWVPG